MPLSFRPHSPLESANVTPVKLPESLFTVNFDLFVSKVIFKGQEPCLINLCPRLSTAPSETPTEQRNDNVLRYLHQNTLNLMVMSESPVNSPHLCPRFIRSRHPGSHKGRVMRETSTAQSPVFLPLEYLT